MCIPCIIAKVVPKDECRPEELRLKVSENRVLRRIFEPTRDEITGEWTKTA